MSYREDKLAAARGWNTWDVYSALSHICMPQGFGLRFGLKDGRSGRYLACVNPGDPGSGARLIPGTHAYDGSYTEAELTWNRITIRVRTAMLGTGDFLARIDLIRNESGFPPELVVEGVTLWNCENFPVKDGRSLRFLCADGREVTAHIVTGEETDDRYLPAGGPYVCLGLDKPVRVSVGQYFAADDLDAMLDARESALYAQSESRCGTWGETALKMQSALAWNLIYDPGYKRPMFVSSRKGSVENGGFLLSGWDGFFAGMMLSLDSPMLARVCVHAALGGAAVLGFVTGESAGRGVTLGRSLPPVGGLCLRRIWEETQDREFAQECFELLLEWNRWWEQNRKNGEMLAYGCDPFADLRTAEKIDGRTGALLETGAPTSPLYAPENAAYDEKRDLFALHDVGLNALYACDCACLAFVAGELGLREEQAELDARAARYRQALASLWDEKDTVYRNLRTDTGTFSPALSLACLYPLLALAPDRERAGRMAGTWLSRLADGASDGERFLVFLGLRACGLDEAKTLAQDALAHAFRDDTLLSALGALPVLLSARGDEQKS